VTYRETAEGTETKNARLLDFKAVYLPEPREFTEAMDLLQARKYQEAQERFVQIKERFKTIYDIPNNPSALAAFYELETLRKMGDLDGLSKAVQEFDKSPITRDAQLRQLELYVLWDAGRSKSWAVLEGLARERAKSRLSGDQRAQVAYLQGLALEGLGRKEEALLAYNTAMTADAGASEDITRQSALRIMTILHQDEEVQQAIKNAGTKQEDPKSAGYEKLLEAASVARMFEKTLGSGAPLPTELKELTKYLPVDQPKTSPAQKPKKAPTEKKRSRKKSEPKATK
jgi:tetratricopeptide (TPR) repeat protein